MNVKTQANNKFTLVAAGAAAVLVISFFLPWMTASFGGFGSVSMSWVDYITTAGSPWAQDVQSLLVVAAAVAAPVCAFLVFVQGRRSQAFLGATLLSFVGAAIGSAWLLVQFNQTFGGETGMAPGLGLWLYLVASLVGAGASFRLFNPASASLLPRLAGSAPNSPAGNYGTYTPPSAGAPSAPAWATPPYAAPPAWSTQPPVAPPAPMPPAPAFATPPAWSTPVAAAVPPSATPAPAVIPPAPAAPVASPAAPIDAPAMKACPSCTGMIDASARFCHFCGFALSSPINRPL